MSAISRAWRWFRGAETLDGLIGWWVTKALITAAFAGVTVVSGLFEDLPFTYIWVSTVIVGSATLVALIRLDDWRRRSNLRTKFRSLGYHFSWNPAPEDENLLMEGAPLIRVENISPESIEFEVTDVRAVLNDRTSSSLGLNVLGEVFTVQPMSDSMIGLHPIRLDFRPPGQLTGEVDVTFKYGRLNRGRPYELRRRFSITIDVNASGTMVRGLELKVPFKPA